MGIDRDELQDPEALDCELECHICLGLSVDAVANKCGHSFCRVCIERALEVDPRCPMCRQSADVESLETLHLVNMRVGGINVCCERRCGWFGRCDQRRAHAKDCRVARNLELTVRLQGYLGIGLEVEDQMLVVTAIVAESAVDQYNKAMENSTSRQIRAGYTIVEANGVRGEATEVLHVILKVGTHGGLHRLVFQKPREVRAKVGTMPKPLGLRLDIKEKGPPLLYVRMARPCIRTAECERP